MNIKTLIKKVVKDSKDTNKDFEIKWAEKELEILEKIKSAK